MSKNKEKFGIVLPIILLSYFMILLGSVWKLFQPNQN